MLDNLENIPLFYTAKPLVKMAARYQKLSENPKEWGQQILDNLYTEHPQLNGEDVQIHWTSQDEKTGNAVGRVVVAGKLAVPIFVEAYKLAPMDTFVFKGKPYRMNPHRLREVLMKTGMFDGVITPQQERGLLPDQPIYRSTWVNPFDEGRRIYASLLDAVLPAVSRTELEKFAKELNDDPQIYVNYCANGFKVAIDHILALKPISLEKTAETLTGNFPVTVAQFKHWPDGKIGMKLASDMAYSPHEVVITPDRFRHILASLGVYDTGAALRKAASDEGYTVVTRKTNRNPTYVSDIKSARAIDKFGFYQVKDVHGREHQGWVIPQVYNLGKMAMDRMLFVGEKFRRIQDKIAGVSLVKEGAAPEFVSDVPKVGDFGSLVFEGHGNALALEPMKIASIEKDKDGTAISVHDALGAAYCFRLSKMAKDLVPVPGDVRTFLVPASAKFACLTNASPVELHTSPQHLTKLAEDEVKGDDFCTIKSIALGRCFLLEGPIAEKMGAVGQEQNPSETIFKLACMGLDTPTSEALLRRARQDTSVTISGLRPITPYKDAFGHEKMAEFLNTLASLPVLKQDTVKIAAEIKDPEILDRVLSLNFLNPSNIGVLVDHMDDLENTSSRLSEMLLSCRMGAKKDINEDAVIQARQAIDDTLDGLANLKSRLGPQTNLVETGGITEE